MMSLIPALSSSSPKSTFPLTTLPADPLYTTTRYLRPLEIIRLCTSLSKCITDTFKNPENPELRKMLIERVLKLAANGYTTNLSHQDISILMHGCGLTPMTSLNATKAKEEDEEEDSALPALSSTLRSLSDTVTGAITLETIVNKLLPKLKTLDVPTFQEEILTDFCRTTKGPVIIYNSRYSFRSFNHFFFLAYYWGLEIGKAVIVDGIDYVGLAKELCAVAREGCDHELQELPVSSWAACLCDRVFNTFAVNIGRAEHLFELTQAHLKIRGYHVFQVVSFLAPFSRNPLLLNRLARITAEKVDCLKISLDTYHPYNDKIWEILRSKAKESGHILVKDIYFKREGIHDKDPYRLIPFGEVLDIVEKKINELYADPAIARTLPAQQS